MTTTLKPASTTLKMAWYGDDFTGATDTLSEIAQAGLRTVLFLRAPTEEQLNQVGALDAMGIAGVARSLDQLSMQEELLPVMQFLRKIAPPIVHYKLCSTFDSAPHVGNLHVAAQTLLPAVERSLIPIIGGQPSLGRYCTFSNLFAQAGAGAQVQRIDRHATMARHPITPMHEADLRQHLEAQGFSDIAHVHYPSYAAGQEALLSSLHAHETEVTGASASVQNTGAPRPAKPVLLDVSHADQLPLIGAALWPLAQQKSMLVLGSSSVAQALTAHWRTCTTAGAATTQTNTSQPSYKRQKGPAFLFAGSLSPVTARQLEAATAYHRIHADAARLLNDDTYTQTLVQQVSLQLQQGQHTLVFTQPQDNQANARLDAALGPALAKASAAFVAQVLQHVAQQQPDHPIRRIGIAGGDTSSHITRALDLWALSYAMRLSDGVTLCRIHSHHPAFDGAEIMLKGGQVGQIDLFDRFALAD